MHISRPSHAPVTPGVRPAAASGGADPAGQSLPPTPTGGANGPLPNARRTAEVFFEKFSKDTLGGLVDAQAKANRATDLAKAMLAQADSNKDALLSLEELDAFIGGAADDETTQRIQASAQRVREDTAAADTNGDGMLSADELSARIGALDLAPAGADEDVDASRAGAFKTLDADGDGILSHDELRKGVSAYRASLTTYGMDDDTLTRAILALDRDQDGGLSVGEFQRAFAADPAAA